MTVTAVLLGIILALSMAVWTYFYFQPAGEPLNQMETLLIVGICAASVFVVRWVWSCIRKGRGRHADEA